MARLAEAYGVPPESAEPAELLFAVQSYFALLVRLLVRQRMAGMDGNRVLEGDPLDWCEQAGPAELAELVARLAAQITRHGPSPKTSRQSAPQDWFKPLYQNLFPGTVRHALGEYYTPRWLADHVLSEVGYHGQPGCRLLDPSCGSGTFLLAAIDRLRRNSPLDGEDLLATILGTITGFDLNPVAVLSAQGNYLLAVADLARWLPGAVIPVLLRDSIGDLEQEAAQDSRWDVVVGNPPWVAWDSLPPEYRNQTKRLWQQYGLFSLSASEARHGGAKKDLAMLMLYTAADRYLREGGRLGMVITQTVFQSKAAGDGFRRFRLGSEGVPLEVLRVDDLSSFQPFADASNWTATIVLSKGCPTTYPVRYVKWSLDGKLPDDESSPAPEVFRQQVCRAEPVDPRWPGSPWLVLPQESTISAERLVGPSDYCAHLGANSGGANGVYWLEILEQVEGGIRVRNLADRGKRSLPRVEAIIEPDLVYPLVRWGDIDRYLARPRAYLLLAQDPVTRQGICISRLAERYPRTLAYLEQFEELLRSRSAWRRYQQQAPYWSMYNVGSYTLASCKVVWRRMDRRIRAAVVESIASPVLGSRPVIPQETCVLVPAESADEAHYLCALLNSAVVDFLVHSHSVCGGKGFGTPSMLEFLRLKRFGAGERLHRHLAACGCQAQELARQGASCAAVQQEIDSLAGQLWHLTPEELALVVRANLKSGTGPG